MTSFDDLVMAGVVVAKEVVLAVTWMTCNGQLWLWSVVPWWLWWWEGL